MTNILWLSEINSEHLNLVGFDAIKLAELYNLQLPIPQGFIVTSNVFKNFFENYNINKQINYILSNVDINNFKLLQNKVNEIKDIIMKAEFPEKLKDEIFEAYDNLNIDENVWRRANKNALELIRSGRSLPYVAVRSILITHKNNDKAVFLNVKGISSLINVIKRAWLSAFSFDNIYYREQNYIPHENVSMSLIIQKMINSSKSGLVYVNNQDNEIKIEAVYGMVDLLLNKTVEPNVYSVDKNNIIIKDKKLTKQEIYLTRDDFGNNIKKFIEIDKQNSQILKDDEINLLAAHYKRLSEYYNNDVQFEYAIENSKIYLIKVNEVV